MGLVLESVSFNTNGAVRLGSLHCRINGNIPVAPAADIRAGDMPIGVFVPSELGPTISITIKVRNTQYEPMNVYISASETERNLFGDLQFPGFICPARSTCEVHTIASSAYLKQWARQMQRFHHQWKWRYIQNHTKSCDFAETTELIYVIPDLPKSPWETGSQPYSQDQIKYIWTGLLDICYNACLKYKLENRQMPATAQEYVTAFTDELNQNSSFRYDTEYGASYYTMRSNSEHLAVKLNKYLEDRQYLGNRLNCTDCATLVQITCRACGIRVSNAVMTGVQQQRQDGYFDTNQVIAIGCDQWAFPFSAPGEHGGFSYHEITAFDDKRDKNTHIYDACLLIDGGEYPSRSDGPDYKKKPQLPCNIQFAGTAENMVSVPPGKPYQPNPNCYRERLVCDGQNCNILPYVAEVDDIDLSVALQKQTVLVQNSYLDFVRERYGLLENPLPHLVEDTNIQSLEILSKEPFSGHCLMVEDYGRCQIYRIEYEQTEFRVEVIFTLQESEAYARLVYALAQISCPYVYRVEMGDIGYAIDSTFYLFVRKNVLLRVSNEVEGSTVSAEPMARMICDSL